MIRFVDLFSGCGGLSLGLSLSGGQGLFAIERDPMAFRTFKANLVDRERHGVRRFDWPDWLEQRAHPIDDLLAAHSEQLRTMRELKLELIAGGPPCQGFSFAGRRNADDPRNQLFKRYLAVVRLVKPTAVLLENVPGMAVPHGTGKLRVGASALAREGSYFAALRDELGALGYDVEGRFLDASSFGVPQKRTRLIVVGALRERIRPGVEHPVKAFFDRLEADRLGFVESLRLKLPVSAEDAIGDLSILTKDGRPTELRECEDPESARGFLQLAYDGRRARSTYQVLMHAGVTSDEMDSMRLARHNDDVRYRFREIIETCRPGVRMSDSDRDSFKLKKHRIHPMAAAEPAPTITTLPDDILHFRDPRILTVREYARLQSFPDWFTFKGKYTTGGDRRKRECPRYTQAGNAVPPLLAMAIGRTLASWLADYSIGDKAQATHEQPMAIAA
jgi:DNA (cytosine-5)-methyltransferase 1